MDRLPLLLVPAALVRRRMRSLTASAAEEKSEFPELPGWLNEALYGLGWTSSSVRRIWPIGSSLFLAARKG